MKNNFKEAVLVMYLAQLIFFICSIVAGVYWCKYNDKIVLIIAILSMYLSMNFYGLKIHLGRQISKDFENKTKESIKIWSDLNRRSRRKLEPKIRQELKKDKLKNEK